MSDIFITLTGVYHCRPGAIAIYELIKKMGPEIVHILLLEMLVTYNHIYMHTKNDDLLDKIEFIRNLDEAVLKCRVS